MDYIIGFVFGVLLIAVCVLLWDKFHKKAPIVERIKDLELAKKEEELAKHFEAIMNYDTATAYKKVTHE